ncbi:hypothetical protein KY290_022107 [Solanum tuberosum]|uniref:Uncharacterized protein n=1 Tax=Solanum tuberosum TaxID=4113 RepID=A0ABQ7V3F3_SOLTU|nr:hypothetical protein KY284_021082 [Solanum tuberosum]KAH0683489.1 hypothetical protein KY289_021241 [Solanum tuberosum]KAH0758614.1 hypothetical protein KY290_022107 [Solanum tuberosum]
MGRAYGSLGFFSADLNGASTEEMGRNGSFHIIQVREGVESSGRFSSCFGCFSGDVRVVSGCENGGDEVG